MTDLKRRNLILSGLAAGIFSGAQAFAQSAPGYTVDNYPYQPDDVFTVLGRRNVNMDIGLLHPQTGAATSGWYASLDPYHGTPFGSLGWRNFYRNRIGSDVHDTDQGTLLLLGRHITSHGITVDEIVNAYKVAKSHWDGNPQLRVAGLSGLEERDSLTAARA